MKLCGILLVFIFLNCLTYTKNERQWINLQIGKTTSSNCIIHTPEGRFFINEKSISRRILLTKTNVDQVILIEKNNEFHRVKLKSNYNWTEYIFYNTLSIPFIFGIGFLIDPFSVNSYELSDLDITKHCS
ncbi:hypothetical protein CH366_19265 [Leptospira harrisiae]|nr:hypothetical protein CH366_19265 [Leptospira harrisiae]